MTLRKRYKLSFVFFYIASTFTSVAHGALESESSLGTTGLRQFRMLYVMDPDGVHDFQEVLIDNFTSVNLLAWVRELRDELTRTENNPAGQYLKVGTRPDLKVSRRFFKKYDLIIYTAARY